MGFTTTKRALVGIINLSLLFLFLFLPAKAYEPGTHANLNQLGAELIRDKDRDKNLYSEIYLHITQLREGGIREDDGGLLTYCGGGRFMQHFYQPGSGLGLAPTPGSSRCIDAVTWARNSDDNLTWVGAIETYDYTSKSKTGDANIGFVGAYERLGHVAHLIGDMAQPDHVHVEPHIPAANDWENWVLTNWGSVAPSINGLTPNQLNTMELHLTELAAFTYEASSFQGGVITNTVPHIDPNSEFGRMFRVDYNSILGQWDLNNRTNGAYLGDWDGEYDSDDNFWETRTETGHGAAGLYYVEEIIDAIPTEYKGQQNILGLHLGRFYSSLLLPRAVRNIAGLYQHFYDIVNHPPYVYQVTVSQNGKCIYKKFWKDSIVDHKVKERKLEFDRNCKESLADPKGSIEITVEFGNNQDGNEERIDKDALQIELIDENNKVCTLTNKGTLTDEKIWTGSFEPSASLGDCQLKGAITIAISAKDKNNHFSGRTPYGDDLDSHPDTPAKTIIKQNNPLTYSWYGYDPGVDLNHQFYVGGGEVDAVLIIDSSGSMSTNDPQGRRKDSAKAYIDSAQPGDSIAIVRFSDGASVLSGLRTITSPDDRVALKSVVDQVGQSGGTNINAGLNVGFNQLLYGSENKRKVAVLLTDGEHNVGPYDPQSHLQFSERRWTLHTIGLGTGSGLSSQSVPEPETGNISISAVDPNFLTDIAAATGGEYFFANAANELINLYKKISGRTSGAEEIQNSALTLNQGETRQVNVGLQDYRTSATFFTNWNNGDVSMSLTTPSGAKISPTTVNSKIYHAKAGIYELYTIQTPELGQWTVNLNGASLPASGETVNVQVSAINGIPPTGISVYLPFIVNQGNGEGPPPPPPPTSSQQFTINIGDVVGNGVPGIGAGNIETNGSKDIYTFNASPGQVVYFDERGASDTLRWSIQDINGAFVVPEQPFATDDPGLRILQRGGDYTIEVKGSSNTDTGTYQFRIMNMPLPQTFNINVEDVVSKGIPVVGAGYIETIGSKDIYTFNASPGQVVYFDGQGAFGNIYWQVKDSNGTVVVPEQVLSTSDPGFRTLNGGTYTVVVRGYGDTNVGTYQFKISGIPSPQQFNINIDDVISNGIPAAGAGNIEAIGSKDIYTFTASPGQQVYFDGQGASSSIYWQIKDANGTGIVTEQALSTADPGLRTLQLGGTYTITVRGYSDSYTGTYQFQIRSIPSPQQFTISVGDIISNGIPAAGAGTIEAIGSKDIYTFTASPGQQVYFDGQGASGSVLWQVKDTNGTVVVSEQTLSTGDPGLRTLQLGGTYTVTVRGYADSYIGTYQFQVRSIPSSQRFNINIDSVVSNGVPAAGAGNIEAIGSKDIYTFTASPGQQVYFDEQGAVGSMLWQVQDANGTVVIAEQTLSTGDPGLLTLGLGGIYTITVRGYADSYTGTYQFQVRSLPSPQRFNINIDSVVSNGVPAAGAGTIEAIGSKDIYTFTASPGQQVYFDEQGAVGSIYWQVKDANGTVVVYEQVLSTGDPGLRTLQLGGTYTITVRGYADSYTGTYQFQITAQ